MAFVVSNICRRGGWPPRRLFDTTAKLLFPSTACLFSRLPCLSGPTSSTFATTPPPSHSSHRHFSSTAAKSLGPDPEKLNTTLIPHPRSHPLPALEELYFGRFYTDHILEIDWTLSEGWKPPRIRPFGPIMLHPAATGLHYGIQVFDGLKGFRAADGRISLFRPRDNLKRLRSSAKRLTLPDFDDEALLTLIKSLVSIDQKWVPEGNGYSIYIRPLIISTQSLAAQEDFAQVLWLHPDGDDMQMTEVGCMNFFLYWINEAGEKELVTPPIKDNLILSGVTRSSTLDLARKMGECKVSERVVYVKKDFLKAYREGRILEVFGTGTAAIICPINKLHFDGEDIEVPPDVNDPSASIGPLCKKLINQIQDAQYGRTPHPEWNVWVN